jgi:hypothetical protein
MITCPRCKRVSYDANDVRERYCGYCHQFHPAPILLNEAQEAAIRAWAADDRLWTTQETVEINLRTFAREILSKNTT